MSSTRDEAPISSTVERSERTTVVRVHRQYPPIQQPQVMGYSHYRSSIVPPLGYQESSHSSTSTLHQVQSHHPRHHPHVQQHQQRVRVICTTRQQHTSRYVTVSESCVRLPTYRKHVSTLSFPQKMDRSSPSGNVSMSGGVAPHGSTTSGYHPHGHSLLHHHDASSTYIQGPNYVQSQGSYPLSAASPIYARISPNGSAYVSVTQAPAPPPNVVTASSSGPSSIAGSGTGSLHSKKGSLLRNGDMFKRSRAQTSYELSQDILDKQIEVLERKYGGNKARTAALTIQRAFRRYTLLKKFADITAMAKAEKRCSRRLPPTDGNGTAGMVTLDSDNAEYVQTYDNGLDHDVSLTLPSGTTVGGSCSAAVSPTALLPGSVRTLPMRSMSLRERRTTGQPTSGQQPMASTSETNDNLTMQQQQQQQQQMIPRSHSGMGHHWDGYASYGSVSVSSRHSVSGGSSGGSAAAGGSPCSGSCTRKVPPEVPKRTSSISNRSHHHHHHHHHSNGGMHRTAENGSLSSVQSSGSDSSSISADRDRGPCEYSMLGPLDGTATGNMSGAALTTGNISGATGSPVWKRKTTTGSASSLQHTAGNDYADPQAIQSIHLHHHHTLNTPPTSPSPSVATITASSYGSGQHQHMLDTSLGSISTHSAASTASGGTTTYVNRDVPEPTNLNSGVGSSTVQSGTVPQTGSYKISETVRKRQYRVGLNLFNKKPDRGVGYLIRRGFVENSPQGVARFLISRKGLSKQMIGEYLGNLQSPFCMAVLECFAMELDLAGMQVDVALRKFQQHFRMPGEAQKIERLMEIFSQRYCRCNSDIVARLRSPDSVFVLAFAIIMLNTDLHTPNLKPERRMRLEDFTRNLRGIDDCGDIDADMLAGIYERVRDNEFKPGSDHVTQVMKVQATIVGKKPNMALPHRRLVCYCRLYEIPDTNKKERPGVHQREVFLFNDLLVITKIFSKKKSSVTYTFRNSFPLCGMVVTLFEKPHYPFGIHLLQRVDKKPLVTFNARNEHDRCKFAEDLKESVSEMDEMENLRIEAELERQKSSRGTRSGGENRDSGVADVEVCSCQQCPCAQNAQGISVMGTDMVQGNDDNYDTQIKRSALSNSLLDIHEQFVTVGDKGAQRRGSVGSLDSGMSVSFQSTSASTCSRSEKMAAANSKMAAAKAAQAQQQQSGFLGSLFNKSNKGIAVNTTVGSTAAKSTEV